MISFMWYIIALLCVVTVAGIGMDFSPSFTAMFLAAFLALTVLSEVFRYFKGKKHRGIFTFFEYSTLISGAVLLFPASMIYAAGDDWYDTCLGIALISSVILHCAIYFLFYHKQSRKMEIGAGIENWLLLAAGLFTLFSAVPSPGLWPYGSGIGLILIARRLGDVKADWWLPRGMMVLGMLLCAVFLVAPMVF